MNESGDKQNDQTAFFSGPLEDLTLQDALIISAVYAVEADTEKCKQISAMAKNHPLFEEQPEATSARVNKFANLMQSGQSQKAVEAVTRDLEPDQRQQAFVFASEAALSDRELTNDRRKALQALATKLNLNNEFVEQELATIQDRSAR